MKLLPLILATVIASAASYASSLDSITPRPLSAEMLKGSMRVAGVSVKCDPSIDATGVMAISRFAADLSLACGKTCVVSTPVGLAASVGNGSAKGLVFLKDSLMSGEQYRISIDHNTAVVEAGSSEGLIRSLQTLRQLLPDSIRSGIPSNGDKWVLPCCVINDSPEFSYRGMMLDCSRHFWSTEEIKRCIDLMEEYKLNRFHWHLTDDQGWRIEIKSLPGLTRTACWREGTETADGTSDHIRYGGYYTQDEIREIVKYAADRGIETIPEISIPGHFLAALSAYPGIGCTKGPYQASTGWDTSDQLICAGNDDSYAFLASVLAEVSALFPGKYIHVGGADCITSQWEKCPDCQARISSLGLHDSEKVTAEQQLLAYFFDRVRQMLADNGKYAICREEVLDWTDPDVLAKTNTVVMCGYGSTRASKAAEYGIPVIFSGPESGATAAEPIGSEADEGIIGLQEDVWTEHITTGSQLEDELLERLRLLSEIQW